MLLISKHGHRRRLLSRQFFAAFVLAFSLIGSEMLFGTKLVMKLGETEHTSNFSAASSSDSVPPWERGLLSNRRYPKVFHVIGTRFMQHQPNLTTLGMARFKLLEAFTFPNIIKQSNQDFLWIIRTDPDLNHELRERLLDLVKDVPNCVVVASNENPEGFKCRSCMDGINQDSVWAGDIELLESYYKAAVEDDSIVLDTKLDADDALYLDFVEDLQRSASSQILSPDDFRIFCAKYYMGWHFLPSSLMNTTAVPVATSNKGMIKNKNQSFCLSAGLTFGYGSNVSRKTVKHISSSHKDVQHSTPQCNGTFPSSTNASLFHNQSHCLIEVISQSDHPAVLRARCPTSNSMGNVDVQKDLEDLDEEMFLREQDNSWRVLEHQFRIEPNTVWDIQSKYMQTALAAMVSENLSGMCQPGFSCGDPAKERLQKLASLA